MNLKPNNIEDYYFNIGLHYYSLYDYNKAIEYYEKALELISIKKGYTVNTFVVKEHTENHTSIDSHTSGTTLNGVFGMGSYTGDTSVRVNNYSYTFKVGDLMPIPVSFIWLMQSECYEKLGNEEKCVECNLRWNKANGVSKDIALSVLEDKLRDKKKAKGYIKKYWSSI